MCKKTHISNIEAECLVLLFFFFPEWVCYPWAEQETNVVTYTVSGGLIKRHHRLHSTRCVRNHSFLDVCIYIYIYKKKEYCCYLMTTAEGSKLNFAGSC